MKGQGLFRRVKDFFTPKKKDNVQKQTKSPAEKPVRAEESRIPREQQFIANKYRKNNRKNSRARYTQYIILKDGRTKCVKHIKQ